MLRCKIAEFLRTAIALQDRAHDDTLCAWIHWWRGGGRRSNAVGPHAAASRCSLASVRAVRRNRHLGLLGSALRRGEPRWARGRNARAGLRADFTRSESLRAGLTKDEAGRDAAARAGLAPKPTHPGIRRPSLCFRLTPGAADRMRASGGLEFSLAVVGAAPEPSVGAWPVDGTSEAV